MNFFWLLPANAGLNEIWKKGDFLETVIIFIQYMPRDEHDAPMANGTCPTFAQIVIAEKLSY